MQTAETFTTQTFFKLLLLFVLLITGVVFKAPDLAPVAEAKKLNAPAPVASEPDSSRQIQPSYFRVASSESASAAL